MRSDTCIGSCLSAFWTKNACNRAHAHGHIYIYIHILDINMSTTYTFMHMHTWILCVCVYACANDRKLTPLVLVVLRDHHARWRW